MDWSREVGLPNPEVENGSYPIMCFPNASLSLSASVSDGVAAKKNRHNRQDLCNISQINSINYVGTGNRLFMKC